MARKTLGEIWDDLYGGGTLEDRPDFKLGPIQLDERPAPTQKQPEYDPRSLLSHFIESNKNNLGGMVQNLTDVLYNSDKGSVQTLDDIKAAMRQKNDNPLLKLIGQGSPENIKQRIATAMEGEYLLPAAKEKLQAALDTNDPQTIADAYEHQMALRLQQDQINRYSNTNRTFINEALNNWGKQYQDEHPLWQTPKGSPEYYAQGLGSTLPSAAVLAVATAAAARQKDFRMVSQLANVALGNAGASARVAAVGGELAAHGAFQWLHSIPEASTEGQSAYEDAIKRGLSQQQAQAVRQEVVDRNIVLLMATNTGEGALAAGSVKLPGLKGKIASTLIGKAINAGRNVAGTTAQNALEEYMQQVIPEQAITRQDSGYAAEIDPKDRWRAALIGGLSGAGMHAAGKAGGYVTDKLMKTGDGIVNDEVNRQVDLITKLADNQRTLKQDAPTLSPEAVKQSVPAQVQMASNPADVLSTMSEADRERLFSNLSTNTTTKMDPEDAMAVSGHASGITKLSPEERDSLLLKYADSVSGLSPEVHNAVNDIANPVQVLENLRTREGLSPEDKQEIDFALRSKNIERARQVLRSVLSKDEEKLSNQLRSMGAEHEVPSDELTRSAYGKVLRQAVSQAEYEGEQPVVTIPRNNMMTVQERKALAAWAQKGRSDGEWTSIKTAGGELFVKNDDAENPTIKFRPKEVSASVVHSARAEGTLKAFQKYTKDNYATKVSELETALQTAQKADGVVTARTQAQADAIAHVAANKGIPLSRFKKVAGQFTASIVGHQQQETTPVTTPVEQQNKNINEWAGIEEQKQQEDPYRDVPPPSDEYAPVVQQIKDVLSNNKGGTNIPGKAWGHLLDIGKRVYDSGVTNGQKWTQKMKELLAEVWGKVRPFIGKLWKEVKATLSSERGSVRVDFSGRSTESLQDDIRSRLSAIKGADPEQKKQAIKGYNDIIDELERRKAFVPKPNSLHPVKQESSKAVNTGTEVINLRNIPASEREAYKNRPEVQYIGRKTKWGNPFESTAHTVAANQIAVDKYRAWLESGKPITHNGYTYDPSIVKRDIEELRGKKLACWDKPLPCHGDVLKSLLESSPKQESQQAVKPATQETVKPEIQQTVKPSDMSYNDLIKIWTDPKALNEFLQKTGVGRADLAKIINSKAPVKKPQPKNTTPQTVVFDEAPTGSALEEFTLRYLKEHGGNLATKDAAMRYYIGSIKEKPDGFYAYNQSAEFADRTGIAGIAYNGKKTLDVAGQKFQSIADAYGYLSQKDDKVNEQNLTALLEMAMDPEEIRLLGGVDFLAKCSFGNEGPLHGKGTKSMYVRAAITAYNNLVNGVHTDVQVLAELDENHSTISKTYTMAGLSVPGKGSEDYQKVLERLNAIKESNFVTFEDVVVRDGGTLSERNPENPMNTVNLSLARALGKEIRLIDKETGKAYVSKNGSLLVNVPVKKDKNGKIIDVLWDKYEKPEGTPFIGLPKQYRTGKSNSVRVGLGTKWVNPYASPNPTYDAFSVFQYINTLSEDLLNSLGELEGARLVSNPRRITNANALVELYKKTQNLTEGKNEIILEKALPFPVKISLTVRDGRIIRKENFARANGEAIELESPLIVAADFDAWRVLDAQGIENELYGDTGEFAEYEKESSETPQQEAISERYYKRPKLGLDAVEDENDKHTLAGQQHFESGAKGKSAHKKTSTKGEIKSIVFEDPVVESRGAFYGISEDSKYTKVSKNIIFPMVKREKSTASDMSFNAIFSDTDTFMSEAEAIMMGQIQNGIMPAVNDLQKISALSDGKAIYAIQRGNMEEATPEDIVNKQQAKTYLATKYASLAVTYARNAGRTNFTADDAKALLMGLTEETYIDKDGKEVQKVTNIEDAAMQSVARTDKSTTNWQGRIAAVVKNAVMAYHRQEKGLTQVEHTLAQTVRDHLAALSQVPKLTENNLNDENLVAVAGRIDEQLQTAQGEKKQHLLAVRRVLEESLADEKTKQNLVEKLVRSDAAQDTSLDNITYEIPDEREPGSEFEHYIRNIKDFTDPVKKGAFKQAVKEQLAKVRDQLDTFEQMVFDIRYDMYDPMTTAEQIADAIGSETESVQTALDKIREMLDNQVNLKEIQNTKRPKVPKTIEQAMSSRVALGNVSKAERALRKTLQALGVHEVIFFNDANGPNGIYHTDANGRKTIYVNQASALGPVWAAGHELGHHILSQHPNLLYRLATAANITSEQIKKRKAQLKSMGITMEDSAVLEEMVCDAFGNSILTPSIYNRLINGDKSVYVRAMASIVRFVQKWTGNNKLTGLTNDQSETIRKALLKHLDANVRILYTDLQDFQNVLDHRYANDIYTRMRDKKLVYDGEIDTMFQTVEDLTRNGYIESVKFSLDSQTVQGTWFGKLAGVMDYFNKKDTNIVVAKTKTESGGTLNWLDLFKSPNLLATKSRIAHLIVRQGQIAEQVQKRLQGQWGGEFRSVIASLDQRQLQSLTDLMHAEDYMERYPVTAVRLADDKYVLLNTEDVKKTTEKKGTAHKLAADLKAKGFQFVEVVEGYSPRSDGDSVKIYAVVATKEKPVFHDNEQQARHAAEIASIEALRSGAKFRSDNGQTTTHKLDETSINAYLRLRELYENIYKAINDVREQMGADPIGHIDGYIPHMFEDFWVYTEGDKSPIKTLRSASDAIDFARELTEKNRTEMEKQVSGWTGDIKKLATLYYGIGGKDPIVKNAELAAALGWDAQKTADLTARMLEAGNPSNAFMICGRPHSVSGDAYQNARAFMTADMLSTMETDDLRKREGLTLGDFASRYGAMEGVSPSEQHGYGRSLAHGKGRVSHMGGYTKDLVLNTNRYLNQASRYCAMEPFKLRTTALYRNYFGLDMSQDASHNTTAYLLRKYIQFVNGEPGWVDKRISEIWQSAYDKSPLIARALDAVGGRDTVNHILFFTSVMKLGMNVTSAFLNFTQLANTYAILGPKYATQAFGRCWNIYNMVKSGKAKTEIEPITGKTYQDLFDMFGLDTQIDLSGTSDMHANSVKSLSDFMHMMKNDRMGLAYEMGEHTMAFFKFTDALARITTCFATLEKEYPLLLAQTQKEFPAANEADVKIKTLDKLAQIADHNNRICNFDNSNSDSALIFHTIGKPGAMVLQFKKYAMKTAELLCRLAPTGKDNNPAGWKRFGYFLFGQFLLSGFYGIPLGPSLINLIGKIFGWDEPETELKALIWKSFGGSPFGNAMAAHMIYGGFSHIGMDLHRRTGYDFLQFNPDDLPGPFLNTVFSFRKMLAENPPIDVYKVEKDLLPSVRVRSDWGKLIPDMMTPIFPGMGAIMQAGTGQKYSTEGRARLIYNYSPWERVTRALGARPLAEAVEADKSHFYHYADQQYQEEARKLKDKVNRFLDAKQPIPLALQQEMAKYHVTAKQLANASKQQDMTREERVYKGLPKSIQKDVDEYRKIK